MSALARAGHLAGGFVRSLWWGPPRPSDEAWARTVLAGRERALFERLTNHDRRHAISVARHVEGALGAVDAASDPRWLEAALLHDVGKWDARLGIPGRVVATAAIAVAGRVRVARGTGRFARYARHGELGALAIRAAGGSDAAAAWAELHHHPDRFGEAPVPPAVVAALDAADNA